MYKHGGGEGVRVRVGVNKDVSIMPSLAQAWPNVPVVNLLHIE